MEMCIYLLAIYYLFYTFQTFRLFIYFQRLKIFKLMTICCSLWYLSKITTFLFSLLYLFFSIMSVRKHRILLASL